MVNKTDNENYNIPETGSAEGEWGKLLNDNFKDIDVKVVKRGVLADRPAASTDGRLYIATDTHVIYYDDGSSWNVAGGNDVGGNDLTDSAASETIYDASNGYVPASVLQPDIDAQTVDFEPLTSPPTHRAGRVALADGSNWDPDSDSNGELVISDGSSWVEIVDMGTTL